MLDGGLIQRQSSEDESQPNVVYVEYGAGKAGLSSFVAMKLAELHLEQPFEKKKMSFLVIDRESRRYKKDNKVKSAGFDTDRQKIDIADFDLVKYTELLASKSSNALQVVGIAKHLCGGATDLALTSFSKLDEGQLVGLSMATCCHHTCDTKTYVNMPFIEKELGIPAHQFNAFVKCSSWAVSPTVLFSPKRRAGFKLKRLLDLGRLLFIRDMRVFEISKVRGV